MIQKLVIIDHQNSKRNSLFNPLFVCFCLSGLNIYDMNIELGYQDWRLYKKQEIVKTSTIKQIVVTNPFKLKC